MQAYAWSIAGNGSLTGVTTQAVVSVLAGNLCNSNFILTLTVTSNNCSSSCSFAVLVQDTNAPTIVCSTNIIAAESPRDTGLLR